MPKRSSSENPAQSNGLLNSIKKTKTLVQQGIPDDEEECKDFFGVLLLNVADLLVHIGIRVEQQPTRSINLDNDPRLQVS